MTVDSVQNRHYIYNTYFIWDLFAVLQVQGVSLAIGPKVFLITFKVIYVI
jgi:hypothetical protein